MSDLSRALSKLANIKERRDKELSANGRTPKYRDLHAQYLQWLQEVGRITERDSKRINR